MTSKPTSLRILAGSQARTLHQESDRSEQLKTGVEAKGIKAGKTVDKKTLQHFFETAKDSAIETVGLSDAKNPHSSRIPRPAWLG
ncbi:uncharacterized protein NFIA_087970 [Aspergillus fischeri NRRL 181]|uniref:Uncharacterized protein n=1 Tax=Neosartorya fischeri (strain ATCC 1020 / DSM 3700 / CBS 544.65 / FGSC A1164 / JCM 1740 / NRRL 181 / WB 181) TaxID=331117 RepID=A1DHI4_NEOFI|nr:uncharacterized protein NFIA_087970 [Aspergillus fischeri NRRL 181]EAW18841.1 hypothetical protein NFIA_087970 [Aspergillus fischeri NRRL 181]